MRAEDSVWQGCFGNWQPLFIREYWLPIGHLAWQGFLRQGPGMVVCEVHAATATVDWSRTAVPYTARFVPQADLSTCWHDLGLAADQQVAVADAIATYDPTQDAVLLLLGERMGRAAAGMLSPDGRSHRRVHLHPRPDLNFAF